MRNRTPRNTTNVGGPGNGYVAMFNLNGSLIANLVSQGPLNSPWGMAIAPANFGPFARRASGRKLHRR